jgi:hypothetical protein
MKITRIELHLIRVPFDMGAAATAFAGMSLTSVDSLFVRVCTDADVDGWGKGWGHVACPNHQCGPDDTRWACVHRARCL